MKRISIKRLKSKDMLEIYDEWIDFCYMVNHGVYEGRLKLNTAVYNEGKLSEENKSSFSSKFSCVYQLEKLKDLLNQREDFYFSTSVVLENLLNNQNNAFCIERDCVLECIRMYYPDKIGGFDDYIHGFDVVDKDIKRDIDVLSSHKGSLDKEREMAIRLLNSTLISYFEKYRKLERAKILYDIVDALSSDLQIDGSASGEVNKDNKNVATISSAEAALLLKKVQNIYNEKLERYNQSIKDLKYEARTTEDKILHSSNSQNNKLKVTSDAFAARELLRIATSINERISYANRNYNIGLITRNIGYLVGSIREKNTRKLNKNFPINNVYYHVYEANHLKSLANSLGIKDASIDELNKRVGGKSLLIAGDATFNPPVSSKGERIEEQEASGNTHYFDFA